ncbi:MAG: hemerythrin domain-containing protein [Sediminibacterium sp. Gen4]|jgi:hypothetical protein|uniref:hemerythrin domain-containing protein n=1 Tax=unclassified Sediminibacterium TaxID=2635961 RepID=UPI0015BF8E7C|nr:MULTISPECIES: hemerythrin domain-containing protein [unclassified Sediminibacterium]MBW0161296.1 hemerythrin domain-containing protein [Sediminibacterium sp.]MBW0165135.1 hemerythrin domain-containing protein [Sediminibacterium sp.]NWK64589.1 hemerythrin domain-containing protein [Sediminibacterium sp. Gen4]
MNQLTRYNPFHQIHQGLRAMLYHCSLQVQHTNFADEEQASTTIAQLKELIWLFDGHAHTEDTKVFSLLADKAPEVIADFEQQHDKDHMLAAHLQGCIEQYEAAVKSSDKVFAGRQIQFSLAEFTAFNLSHMNMEEVIIKELIWQHYTDEQLHELTMEIVSSLPPDKNARYSYWMLKGLSITEIAEWFRAIQATAPPFVMDQMMELAAAALDCADFNEVQKSLALEMA